MSDEAKLLADIKADILDSPSQIVIYLEGRTDPDIFFAMLGMAMPAFGLHRGVLVKGLKDEGTRRGSGSNAVQARVELASRNRIARILGLMDGDGRPVSELAATFNAPYPGPLFRWKAYCIENLLAKTGWPATWGDTPDWRAELVKYGPYIALNRIGSEARSILRDLGIANFTQPILGSPLRLGGEIASALAAGKARFLTFDAERRFLDELADFEATVHRNLDEAHAFLNGKWLVRHVAPSLTGHDPDRCQFEWLAHARSVGGLPEVREWWERVTGSPP